MSIQIEDSEYYYCYSTDLNSEESIALFEDENPIYNDCIKMGLILISYYIKCKKDSLRYYSYYMFYNQPTDEIQTMVVDNTERCYWILD